MKKYTKPELSISVFDVEDIITTSGVIGTDSLTEAKNTFGELYTDATGSTTVESVNNAAVVYFSWE